jgi:hypothetical protein
MSNITLFKNDAALPDYLRGADDFTKRIAGGADNKTISIKGGVWRMLSGGEEVAKNEDRAMNFVVVNAAPRVSRTYYDGQFVEGQDASPVCYSADGEVPAQDSDRPQAKTCGSCPQNVAGSGANGSRACRFNQRFAVVLEGDIGGPVYRLQLPAKSLFGRPEGSKMPMQAYAKFLAGHGVPMSGVVTEARFDTGEAVPVLRFTAVRPLTREEVAVAREQSASEAAMQAIEVRYTPRQAQPTAAALPANFAAAPAPAAVHPDTYEVEPKPAVEPVKRASKATPPPAAQPARSIEDTLKDWGSDDE